jgi:hypothetical protein
VADGGAADEPINLWIAAKSSARFTSPPDVKLRYDFRIGDRDVGDFVAEDDGVEIRQWVCFETEDGGRYENRYAVRYTGRRVLAYRIGDGDWVDCSSLPEHHYPTAAYPVLIRAGVREYAAIDEETGAVRRRTLEHAHDRVVERQGDAVVRVFRLDEGRIVRIDWGGATSTLRDERTTT